MRRFELFIARRYLLTVRKALFISIITLISTLGITIGVAALIVVLSVFNGFNSIVTEILVGFDPHIRIESAGPGMLEDYDEVVAVLEEDPLIAAYSPVLSGRAMLVSRNLNRIVSIRGVDSDLIEYVSGVSDALVLGSVQFNREDRSDGIVLGIGLADRLNAMIGDTVSVISPAGMEAALVRFGQPILRRYIVTGIYESQNQDYDAHYAFVSLSSAQHAFNAGDGVSGVELRLLNFRHADRVKKSLITELGDGYLIRTWYDLHRDLYAVMELERWAAYIILSLIIAVATFNILGSLTMTVIEKKRDIGVLKAMGASRKNITRIYLAEGMIVGVVGTVLGSLLGYIVCYIQIHYHLFPLDPTVYIIPAIPVKIKWTDFIAVGGAAMLLSSLAALYPARRASNIEPADAVRWE